MLKSKDCFQVETPLLSFFPLTELSCLPTTQRSTSPKKLNTPPVMPYRSSGYLEAFLRLHDVSDTHTKI